MSAKGSPAGGNGGARKESTSQGITSEELAEAATIPRGATHWQGVPLDDLGPFLATASPTAQMVRKTLLTRARAKGVTMAEEHAVFQKETAAAGERERQRLDRMRASRAAGSGAPAAASAGGRGPAHRVIKRYADVLAERLTFHRADREARRTVDAEERALIRPPMPEGHTLAEVLAEPDEEAVYRIEGLLPVGGHIMLVSAYKAGKTTTIGNLSRSLVDGTDFLGKYPTRPVGSIVVIDDEMDLRTLRRWYRDFDLTHTERFTLYTLRGRLSTFDLMDDKALNEWADMLRGHDVLIIDCLRPILDALGLDENRDTGRFLIALDALAERAGIDEVVLVQHMGHGGERARGDSRLQDWPDVTWKIIRDDPDDPTSKRYFSAYGRDVDEPEQLLEMDDRRSLGVSSTDRKAAKVDRSLRVVLEIITDADGEPLNASQIENAARAKGVGKSAVRDAIQEGRRQMLISTEKGERNATLHYLGAARAPTKVAAGAGEKLAEMA